MKTKKMTILGQHIRLIRPELPKKQIILKHDLPTIKYDKRPKDHEIGCAEFFKICMTHEMVRED